jgi:hypothetical protein
MNSGGAACFSRQERRNLSVEDAEGGEQSAAAGITDGRDAGWAVLGLNFGLAMGKDPP